MPILGIIAWSLLGLAYLFGWARLRGRGAIRLANWISLCLALLALVAWTVVLWPSFARLANRSFFVHMLEHELLIEVAPLLLWLARPVPFLLWALPRRGRRWLADVLIGPRARVRPWLVALTRPRVVVPTYLATVTLWHIPWAFDAALREPAVHALEHASLAAIAVLYWWLVAAAPPRWHRHGRFQLPVLYVVAAYAHNEILGLGLVLLRRPIYDLYGTMTPPWGLSPLEDQALGGAMMWIPGEFIYAVTLMGLLFRLLEEREPYHGVFETYPST